MALFKILKGQEKNLPATKTEGWAYVTTDEGNMYVDVSASKRVRIGSHADKADVATKAEGDTESIRAKYLAKLKQVTSNGTTFTFRGETGDGSDAADLITIPLAGDKAGLISNAAQTIKGEKTFANGIKFPDVTSTTYPAISAGLTWSGSTDGAKIYYEVQASDKGMLIIEARDDTNAGAIFRNSSSKKEVSIIDGLVTGAFKGNLTGTADYADKAKGDSTSIRTTYIHKIKQVTSNGTTFTLRGEYGDGSDASDLITIPNASASVAGLITNAAQTIAGTKTLQGNMVISPGALSNYQEGLRICNANNGWTTLILGGTATSGTSASSWSLHTNGGNFYLTHNGSSNSSTGILQSDTNGNWQIKNKLGVNGQNIGYQFYVNGSSYFNGTVEIQGITTHHSNIQLDNTVRIRRNGRSVSWNQANTYAMMTMDTAEGWSPFIAQKVTNGWWTIGQYNTSGFANDWLFGYLADGNVSGVSGAQNALSTTVRLINVGGDRMFVTSTNRTQHGSNVNPVYISNTGKVTACTYELKSTVEGGSANRLPYYSTANKIAATTHYANTTQIGINENNVAKIGSYSLYVNGTTFIQSNTANSTTDGLIVNNGRINVTNYGYTLRIGNANNAYTHFETSCSQFYFNKQIVVNGNLFPYTNNSNYNGTSSNYWNRTYSQWIMANPACSSTDGGITLFGNGDTNYGIFFRGTGNMGTHGSVTADWATYFTMSNTAGRGWVFRNTGAGNVASISAQGHMTVNGSIGINGTNVGYKLYVNGGESWIHGKLWTGDVVPESNNSKVCGNGSYYWSSMSTRWLHANRGGSSTDGGITLYSTSDTYGIMFRGTSNMGTHGWVTSDWATYFTMNDQNNRGWVFRRHNSKNVFSIDTNGFVWADGSLRANAVGKDGFMTFPRGGQYRTTTSTVTGYLRIQLPVYRSSTMIKFIVDIYNYSDNTSVSYAISGYNYSDGVWHSCTAECLSHHGQDKQNLTVAFGEMNSKSAVMIGSSSTTWSYPQVQIRDIVIGYSNWNYKYWNNADWVIDFSTSPIGNVSRSYSGTDNIRVSRGQFDQLVVINDTSDTEYNALAYIRHYSNNDWAMILDKNNAYDYGLDIRTSTNATYGLRTNGQLIVNSTCGSYREGIRLRGADGTWNTIILGATADSGTNANAWSIHRKNDNNFCISRNSSDGLNGLVMTSTGMGLGTTSPGYRLHVNGKGCFENRIYAHEWIEFNGDRGLYWPSGGYHFYPCTNTSYGSFGLKGTRGGYHGLTIGYDNNFMTVMDNGVDKGLYQASQGMWILYYNRNSKRLGLRTSSLSGYAVTCEGDFYCRNGWLRTNGATGWYNESYGGGWYMTDSTYIRNYANKTVRMDNVCLGADNNSYRLYVNGTSYFSGYSNVCKIYNSSNYGSSSSITFTNLAAYNGASCGMIYAATDNPLGKGSWCHTWSQAWGNGSTSNWVSQIALGTENGSGMWYRCTSGNIAGRGWNRLLDNTYVNVNSGVKLTSGYSWISIAGVNSFSCPNGTAITQPGGANPMVLYSGAASNKDCGILYLSNDNAYIANSSDNGYTFGVFDTDITTDFSSQNNASFCVRSNGVGSWARSRFGVNGINDSYNFYVNGTSYFNGVLSAKSDVDMISHGNEFNVVPTLSGNMIFYFNYRQTKGNNTNGYKITQYCFCDGNGAVLASITNGKFNGTATAANSATTATQLSSNDKMVYGWNGLNYFNKSMSVSSAAGANNSPTADWYHIIRMNHGNSAGYYCDIATCFHNNNMYLKRVAGGSSSGWLHIWVQGNSVTGAVWNDYAEYRQAETQEAGYVLYETGSDDLKKTIERLQHFAGVSSDTWGFSQGETEKAKTPIAVAGRVLVYPYQDRNNYKPGDCVCAAPGGKVDIMTREEVAQYPDRIVGTVSCVPDYEEWGGGELADRNPVKVNGRIWIKVR